MGGKTDWSGKKLTSQIFPRGKNRLGKKMTVTPASLRCGPWVRHMYPSLVLVQPRKTHPCLTERLLMGRKESNQTNKQAFCEFQLWYQHFIREQKEKSVYNCRIFTIIQKELTLKEPITTAADANFATSFLIFENNTLWYFMRIVCQQTILMKYHALFVNLKKLQNLKLSSAANNRWRSMGYSVCLSEPMIAYCFVYFQYVPPRNVFSLQWCSVLTISYSTYPPSYKPLSSLSPRNRQGSRSQWTKTPKPATQLIVS